MFMLASLGASMKAAREPLSYVGINSVGLRRRGFTNEIIIQIEEIYRTILRFNSFWFPSQYLQTAAYFQSVKGVQWDDINPKLLLSKDYSSVTGWMTNVDAIAQKTPGLIPIVEGGSSCST